MATEIQFYPDLNSHLANCSNPGNFKTSKANCIVDGAIRTNAETMIR